MRWQNHISRSVGLWKAIGGAAAALTAAAALVAAADAVAEEPSKKLRANAAIVPAAPRKPFYVEQHKKINLRVKQGNVDLVFIGDSITDFWQKQGKAVWE